VHCNAVVVRETSGFSVETGTTPWRVPRLGQAGGLHDFGEMSRVRRVLRLSYESAHAGARIERSRRLIHFDDDLSEDGL